MTYIVDIYGTKTLKFGSYDSDLAIQNGFLQGDTTIRNGTIFTATTDIPPGTDFVIADSELQPESWFASVVSSVSSVDDDFIATQNQTSFELSFASSHISGFYRNGMRLKKSCYSVLSTTVTYDPSQNDNSQIDAGDEISIVYFV